MVYNDWNNDYLAHHGIKGMHWGIRRFQNPDGTLTSAGKERYSEDGGGIRKSSNQPITTRSASGANINKGVVNAANGTGTEKYDKKKYNLKNFNEWPEGRKKALRAGLVAGGAMIVGAGVTYAVVQTKLKKYDGKSDITIPKGDPLFRTEFGDSSGLDNDTFFATSDKEDAWTYIGHYAARTSFNDDLADSRGGVQQRTINASRDVKVAGSDSAIDMIQRNKELFTGTLKDELDHIDKICPNDGELRDKKLKDLFNEWLRGASMSEADMYDGLIAYGGDKENWKVFKGLLKQNGYDGVVDTNDMYGAGGSGIGSKRPMIFVNNNSSDSDVDYDYSTSEGLYNRKISGKDLSIVGKMAMMKTINTQLNRMQYGGNATQLGIRAASTLLGAAVTVKQAVGYYDQYREKKDRIAENKAQKEAKKAATAEKVNASRADITKAIDYGMSSAAIAKRFGIPVSEVKALREQLKEDN